MNFLSENKKRITWWIVGMVTICILLFLGIQNIGTVFSAFFRFVKLISPLILGFAFAVILNVPMRFFEARLFSKSKNKIIQKIRRALAFIISLFVIIGILTGVIWLVIPELTKAVTLIFQGVIGFVNELSLMSESEIAELPFGNLLLNTDWDNMLKTIQIWLKNQSGFIMNTAFDTVGSLVNGTFDLFISFVFSVYILFSKETLKSQASRFVRVWLPEKFGEWLIHAASISGMTFRNFISGQTLEAVILGLLCMLGMFALRIPYAPMVSALVGVTAIIPVVGSFIGAAVGAFVILTVNPVKAVVFVVFLIILQQVEGNLIYPKVMGNRVNLPGMWILAAVTIGGGIAGPVGMLLSVPLVSTAFVLLKEATLAREKNNSTPSFQDAEASNDESKSVTNESDKQEENTP